MILGELGIVSDDLLICHPGGEPSEHIGHGDAHTADRWSTAALPELDGDDVLVSQYRAPLQLAARQPRQSIIAKPRAIGERGRPPAVPPPVRPAAVLTCCLPEPVALRAIFAAVICVWHAHEQRGNGSPVVRRCAHFVFHMLFVFVCCLPIEKVLGSPRLARDEQCRPPDDGLFDIVIRKSATRRR